MIAMMIEEEVSDPPSIMTPPREISWFLDSWFLSF